jgi:hypothetical protein
MSEENEQEAPEVVEKAAAMGHMNKEEWESKGRDPEKWRPATEFVERGENIMPILKERLDHSAKEMAEMKSTMKQMHDHFMKAEEVAERRGWEKAIAEVTKKQVAAVEIADVDEFNRLEKEKFEILNRPPHVPIQSGPPPEFKEFHARNEWYGTDEEATVYADSMGRTYRQKHPEARLEEVFADVEKKVRNRFPEIFSNPRRSGASTVEGATAPVKKNDRSFDALPKEAKDAYARFAKQIPGFTKEQYIKNYQW